MPKSEKYTRLIGALGRASAERPIGRTRRMIRTLGRKGITG